MNEDTPVQIDDVRYLLNEAVARFMKRDKPLLEIHANERSLTHKFAEYLQVTLDQRDDGKWDVDCEYNRDGGDPKLIPEIKKIVGNDAPTDDTSSQTVYPDIIVHKRGAPGPNLIIIEAKKDATDSSKARDVQKIGRIRERYDYTFGVFLNFCTEPHLDIQWEILDSE